MAAAEIDCVVAAPSKLIRPAGDRVKTDGRDAAHLTRLLRLGEITAVTVPEADVGGLPQPRTHDAGPLGQGRFGAQRSRACR